jgi:hypothetical protein
LYGWNKKAKRSPESDKHFHRAFLLSCGFFPSRAAARFHFVSSRCRAAPYINKKAKSSPESDKHFHRAFRFFIYARLGLGKVVYS